MSRDARWTLHTPRGELSIAWDVVPREGARRDPSERAALEAWFYAARGAGAARIALVEIARAIDGHRAGEPEFVVRDAFARRHLRVERRLERAPLSREDAFEPLLHDGAGRSQDDKTWIAIRLVYDDDPRAPVPFARYVLKLPDGSTREGRLDRDGNARVDNLDPGMCEVTFPDYDKRKGPPPAKVPPGKGHQPRRPPPQAPPPRTPQPVPGTSPQCAIATLEVSGGDYDSDQVPFTRRVDSRGAGGVIQVVAGAEEQPNPITVRLSRRGAPCGRAEHARQPIEVIPEGGISFRLRDGESFPARSKLQLSNSLSALTRLAQYVNVLWKWRDLPIQRYTVRADACADAPPEAVVEVYPQISIGVSLTIAWGMMGSRKEREPDEGENGLMVSGALTLGWDGADLDVSRELYGRDGPGRKWVSVLEKHAGWFRKIAKHAGQVEITIPQIQVSLKGSAKTYEATSDHTVRRGGTIQISADPLIGASAELDFLNVLIAAAGNAAAGIGIAVGPLLAAVLLQLKEDLKNGDTFLGKRVRGEIGVGLGLSGGIYVDHEWTIGADAPEKPSTIGGKIEFKVFGKAMLHVRIPVFRSIPLVNKLPWANDFAPGIDAGITAEGTAGFKAEGKIGTDGLGPFIQPRFYFTGMKLSVVVLTSFKLKSKPDPDDDKNYKKTNTGWEATWFEPTPSELDGRTKYYPLGRA